MNEDEDWEEISEEVQKDFEERMKDRLPLGAKIPKDMLCVSCKKHPATVNFSSGGMLEAGHFGTQPICEVCYADLTVEFWEDLDEARNLWRRQLGRLLVAARYAIDLLPKDTARQRLQEAIDWKDYDAIADDEEAMREAFWQKLEASPEFREAYERAFEHDPDDTVLDTKDDIDRFIEELKERHHDEKES